MIRSSGTGLHHWLMEQDTLSTGKYFIIFRAGTMNSLRYLTWAILFLFFAPAIWGGILFHSTRIIAHSLCLGYELGKDSSWGRRAQMSAFPSKTEPGCSWGGLWNCTERRQGLNGAVWGTKGVSKAPLLTREAPELSEEKAQIPTFPAEIHPKPGWFPQNPRPEERDYTCSATPRSLERHAWSCRYAPAECILAF